MITTNSTTNTNDRRLDGELKIEMLPIEALTPYARNPRKNDEAVDRMAASFQEFGFKGAILARRDGEVIDGHLRLKAAQKLGMKRVPVICCDDLTPAQVKALRLLMNRSATWAEWDDELLTLEFVELKDLGVDLAFSGFDACEIDDLLFRSQETPEEPPSTVGEPVTKPGDLWLCESHRVLCGDATAAGDVARLLEATVPVVMITDPPYGVSFDPEWREQAGLGKMRQRGRVTNDDRVDWTPAFQLFRGDAAYVWHAGVYAVEVAQSLFASDFEIRAQIIWAKQHFALSRGNYHWQHEPCWYAVRRGGNARWCGDRTQSTLWEVPNLNPFGGTEEEPTGHGTQKPVELMKRPILNHTERGEAVYDPFLGSGTTLIAAELTDRTCYALEIEPTYVDMAVRRWQALTGKAATLASDGRTFDDVQRARAER